MAKKKPKIAEGFLFFDVIYEDGTRSSRRKVLAAEIEDMGEAHARTAIMDQDRKVSEFSGNSRGAIKSIERSAK